MTQLRSIVRPLAAAFWMLALSAGLAFADPGVRVDYREGVPQVRLDGSWPGTRYTIYRGNDAAGAFAPISSFETVCTGECFVDDFDAAAGRTYWYRFDLVLEDGRFVSFGPYAVPISAERARRLSAGVFPNPGRGATSIQLVLPGLPGAAPADAVAELFDLQGRALRTFHRGTLARGITRIDWDGRDASGASLHAGVYFLRFATSMGTSVTRVVRAR